MPTSSLLLVILLSSSPDALREQSASPGQQPPAVPGKAAKAALQHVRIDCSSQLGQRISARSTRRRASRWCDRRAPRRASSARPGATTPPASGSRTAAAACSSSARWRRCADEDSSAPEYVPNGGFLLFNGEKGQIYFRLFSYARYLNQRNLDATYVGRLRQHASGAAAPGHAAAEVLRAVFGLVPRRRSSATTCTSGRPTRHRAIRRRSSAPAT